MMKIVPNIIFPHFSSFFFFLHMVSSIFTTYQYTIRLIHFFISISQLLNCTSNPKSKFGLDGNFYSRKKLVLNLTIALAIKLIIVSSYLINFIIIILILKVDHRPQPAECWGFTGIVVTEYRYYGSHEASWAGSGWSS